MFSFGIRQRRKGWIPEKLFIFIISTHLMMEMVNGQGCSREGRPLCCEGRDISCKSREAPAALRPIQRFAVQPEKLTEVYCRGQREPIGFSGVLPGFVALDPRGEQLLGRVFNKNHHFRLYEAKRPPRETVGNEVDEEEIIYQFGWPWEEWAQLDRLISDKNWPLIRYSLLNRHLPLRMFKRQRTRPAQQLPQVPQGRRRGPDLRGAMSSGEQWRLFYLAEHSPECFCDQMCVRYGDCCGDYAQQCPAIDCLLSGWSHWSECMPDGNVTCGVGIRERHRHILRPRQNAGRDCPQTELTQQIGCFKECKSGVQLQQQGREFTPPDVTTVALLLDYRYNKSRQVLPQLFKKGQKLGRKSRREIIPTMATPLPGRNYTKYCVHYRIEWLNRNCVEPDWRGKLATGQRICAECQPEAQYHRPRPRCASDLEDGQSGFWKLIGPKSCYGIWRRLQTQWEDCDCANQFPQLDPFLLV